MSSSECMTFSFSEDLPLRCNSLENDSLKILGKKLEDKEEGETLEGGVTVVDLEMFLG